MHMQMGRSASRYSERESLSIAPSLLDVSPLLTRYASILTIAGRSCSWHGGNESEKWHPVNSSLYQLVLSVQSQILVTDPYFNEPAVEAMKGTKEGDQISSAYNSDLKLNTLRYAVNEMIQSPPVGFEDVVRGHFSVLKRRMVEVGKRWVGEAGREGMPPTLQGKMDSEVVKMHGLLSQLE